MTAEDKLELQECIAAEAKRIHTADLDKLKYDVLQLEDNVWRVIGEKDLQIRTLHEYVADLEKRLGEAERGRQDAVEKLAELALRVHKLLDPISCEEQL